MARLSPEQRAEVQAFVHLLYEQSGLPTWAEFARRAELLPSALSHYRHGRLAPNAYNLIRMMRAARVSFVSNGNGQAATEQQHFDDLLARLEQIVVALEAGPRALPPDE